MTSPLSQNPPESELFKTRRTLACLAHRFCWTDEWAVTLRRCSLAWLEHLDTPLSSLETMEGRAHEQRILGARFQLRQPDKCAASSPQAKSDYSFPGQPAYPWRGKMPLLLWTMKPCSFLPCSFHCSCDFVSDETEELLVKDDTITSLANPQEATPITRSLQSGLSTGEVNWQEAWLAWIKIWVQALNQVNLQGALV